MLQSRRESVGALRVIGRRCTVVVPQARETASSIKCMTNMEINSMPRRLLAKAQLGILSVWHDFRRVWSALVVYEVLFKLLEAWLFVPAAAVVLSAALSRAGHVAVSNRDVLDFLLSPFGLLYAILFGSVAVALLLLEQAGIMLLAAQTGFAERPPLRQTLRSAFWKTWRIAQLGVVKLSLLALTFVPFVLLALLTYGIFLSRHDINY